MSQLLSLYENVGAVAFSTVICNTAPYFGTISPTFLALAPGIAAVKVPFCKEITNHLGTVHAIALCNAAELVAGTMTDASVRNPLLHWAAGLVGILMSWSLSWS